MPSFLVSSIWRLGIPVFSETYPFLLEVTAGIILRLSNEFMSDLKVKDPWLPSMSEVDFRVPWGFFDRACQGHPQCVESG
jgi:hypothetical protein